MYCSGGLRDASAYQNRRFPSLFEIDADYQAAG